MLVLYFLSMYSGYNLKYSSIICLHLANCKKTSSVCRTFSINLADPIPFKNSFLFATMKGLRVRNYDINDVLTQLKPGDLYGPSLPDFECTFKFAQFLLKEGFYCSLCFWTSSKSTSDSRRAMLVRVKRFPTRLSSVGTKNKIAFEEQLLIQVAIQRHYANEFFTKFAPNVFFERIR